MNELATTTNLPAHWAEQLATLHESYYARQWRFGAFFTAKVAREAAAYRAQFNEHFDRSWCVSDDARVVANITIQGPRNAGELAHLRWFIVSHTHRGSGLGNPLLALAVAFCRDKNYQGIYLTSFRGLEAARHLYEKYGFKLTRSKRASNWGRSVWEQRFEKPLGA